MKSELFSKGVLPTLPLIFQTLLPLSPTPHVLAFVNSVPFFFPDLTCAFISPLICSFVFFTWNTSLSSTHTYFMLLILSGLSLFSASVPPFTALLTTFTVLPLVASYFTVNLLKIVKMLFSALCSKGLRHKYVQ